ncbi:hypothetical protein MK786_13640 [Microbacterium sp. CFH 31415]|uniref:DUF4190 domain-containing protein n=1 Tax=Microbacterium sp. CFH 31415 TaxID=2921732 RepID=UPI001F1306AD|nr:DUF4190 domain-containing protein [Microbacterium sp. CFH 31415]MCH6231788.1 hypothetical protein [Microbacterium sp. CFH 31415]
MRDDERMPPPGEPAAGAEASRRAEQVPPVPRAEPAPRAKPVPPAPQVPPAPPAPQPAVEPPSPDVSLADEASPLPGAHRGGFLRLPTAPVDVTSQSAPPEPGTEEPAAQWLMPPTDPPHRGFAGWALASSIAGLVVSLFVGWGFPIGLVGVVTAILALRRPLESRPVAIWALVLGVVSILYSAGWLFYAAAQASIIG